MTYAEAIILGIIQGLTEFLPVSSSGHLVISEHLLKLSMPGVSLEIWLHFGTLVAVLVYFFPRIKALFRGVFDPSFSEAGAMRRLLWALVLGTIPAVVVGLFFKDFFEKAFEAPTFAAGMLIVTGTFLLLSKLARNLSRDVSGKRGFIIGLAQALAILPGISRSGSTIVTGLFLGVKPDKAAEFSFLLAIPAIGGAFLLDLLDNSETLFAGNDLSHYLVGAGISFLAGIVSIHYLLRLIRRGKLFYFGYYCTVAGVAALVFI